MKNAASLLIFLSVTSAVVIAGDVKTKIITTSTGTFPRDIPDHHYLKIYNFTQEGTSSPRGVVIASAATPTATPTSTPTATPTPTCTPTCSPSPCAPTPCPPTPSPTPTPTPTPPPKGVLTAAFVDPSASPEFIKQVVVDGPAQIHVDPVSGAKLVLTYQRMLEPTPTPTQ